MGSGSGKFGYVVKWVGGALVAGIVLDNWAGANTLAGTGFTGTTGILGALKSTGTAASTTKTKAGG